MVGRLEASEACSASSSSAACSRRAPAERQRFVGEATSSAAKLRIHLRSCTGSMSGKSRQVGLIRWPGGRASAARTTLSLKRTSYDCRRGFDALARAWPSDDCTLGGASAGRAERREYQSKGTYEEPWT